MEDEDWLTIDQTAKALGVSVRAVHRYVQAGKITPYKRGVGRRTYFRKADIEELLRPRPGRREVDEDARAA